MARMQHRNAWLVGRGAEESTLKGSRENQGEQRALSLVTAGICVMCYLSLSKGLLTGQFEAECAAGGAVNE